MKLIFCFCLIFTAFAADALACQWSGVRTPPCALWTQSDAVFLGKVIKTEKASKGEEMPANSHKVRFQVLENFKGADNPTFTLIETDWETSCDMNPKKSETWIIYARTDIVAKSFARFTGFKIDSKVPNEELETLRAVVAGKTPTTISGRFVSDLQSVKYAFEPVEISVAGGATFNANTDADGAFNIPVPPGNYRVELKFPYRASFKWDENLLGTSLTAGVPTLFKYEVRLGDGDCHFQLFEVSKKMQ